jgi:protein-S-isoprenylcysteine O-methyltransferase Ste14
MQDSDRDNPGVIAFPPMIFALCLVLGIALHFVFPIRVLAVVPSRIAGTILICVAGCTVTWAQRVMKKAGTNIRPDKPALAIVASGPFRLTRNPMYVSLCLLQVGIALLIDGLMPLLLVIPLVLMLHFGVIRREERYLEAKFGEPYVTYRSQVRRWL